jgi:hypothetical protein
LYDGTFDIRTRIIRLTNNSLSNTKEKAVFRVILLAPAAQALAAITDTCEHATVEAALEKLNDQPGQPAPYAAKERREGWEMYVGRWKVIYEIRPIELTVYVHNIKERPSLRFDYR